MLNYITNKRKSTVLALLKLCFLRAPHEKDILGILPVVIELSQPKQVVVSERCCECVYKQT
jgi:hypothetical protein